jgi:molybdate transport system substrate-binding protein
MPVFLIYALVAVFTLFISRPTLSDPVSISTSSNFKMTLDTLVGNFGSNRTFDIISASTGKLTAQINRGAPYDIFLSADIIGNTLDERHAVKQSEFTYAYGQLALVTKTKLESNDLSKLPDIDCIAIANSSVAPYGRAAEEIITKLSKHGTETGRIIRGQSVMQAWQFFDSGACSWALVAYALVLESEEDIEHVVIPQSYHQPVRQHAILLQRAKNNKQAQHFFEFLKSEQARDIIRNAGYLTELP